MAGNISTESRWDGQRKPWVISWDGAGTNKGLMSWNRSRIKNAEKFLGKPLEKASNAEQVKWIVHELKTYYPNAYKVFMNPKSTESQLKKASKEYIGWGKLGDRWEVADQVFKDLQDGKTGSYKEPTEGDHIDEPGGKKFKLLGGGQDPGQVGIDFTLSGGDNRVILPGEIVEIGHQYNPSRIGGDGRRGSGYGNYVVIRSKNPVDGSMVDTLYAHFPKGAIKVKRGDKVKRGQLLGRMATTADYENPNTRREVGSGTGPHTSLDFLTPGSSAAHPLGRKIGDVILKQLSSQGITSPTLEGDTQNIRLATKHGVEGIIIKENGKDVWKPKVWTAEDKERVKKQQNKNKPTPFQFGRPAAASETKPGPKSGGYGGGDNKPAQPQKNWFDNIRGLFPGGNILMNKSNDNVSPLKPQINSNNISKFASYNDPNQTAHVIIQPVIIKKPAQQLAKTMGYPFNASGSSNVPDMNLDLGRA
jgi:murein DD-endopeptidase MepM/ murein hydrolase activator NlpD